jgi:streptogramin lyase
LEDRLCLSGNLLVSSFFTNMVLDYDGTQGSFLGPFASGGGLARPVGLALGPTGDLFVSGRDSNDILRYDGNTGAFLSTFVTPGSGGLNGPHGLTFGPDGNLYVSSGFNASVLRYDGRSGTFLSTFVAAGSGGLAFPHGLTFGPDGNLYVGDRNNNSVLRYNGATGAFIDVFASGGGLNATTGLVFGPDGNLYVDSFNTNSVLRYDGKTGTFLGTFASGGGGLSGPQGLTFGLDGNLYVSSFNTNQVLRYNGTTGAFIDVFASGGGLVEPTYLLFQKTHTTTTLNSSTSASVYGQSVVFTALVNSVAATGSIPTGTVTFIIDGLAQGPVPLSNGQATLSTRTLSPGTHTITASYNGDAGDTTSSSPSFALTVTPAPLTAFGVNVLATAGAPFSGTVATFVNADPFGFVSSYTATITWGDGNSSVGIIADQGGGVFAVSGSHTYADPKSDAVNVLIQHKLGYTTPATAGSTATVTSLGIGVQRGQTGGIGFWQNNNGQALIDSFNGGANATALASWLATTFPNLYGANAGNHNLTGETNAQVATFYLSLFDLSGPKPDAQVLATALNVYATTLSLGGSAATVYGFTVNAFGLGADSFNVGANGAAFGAANFATLNVYELLLAANKQAVNGVLYGGDPILGNEAVNVFDGINEAGGIS